MGVVTIKEGTVIANPDRGVGQIFIITGGSVNALYRNELCLLEKGDVIGLVDLINGYYTHTYTAASEVSLIVYTCRNFRELISIIDSNPDMGGLLATSMTRSMCRMIDNFIMMRYNTDNLVRYINESYSEYKALCLNHSVSAKALPEEQLANLKEIDDIKSWLVDYYESINKFSPALSRQLFVENKEFVTGFIMKTATDIKDILIKTDYLDDYQSELATILLNENHLDLFDLYANLICKLTKNHVDTMSISATIGKLMIQMEGRSTINQTLYQARIQEYRSWLAEAEQTAAQNEDAGFTGSSSIVADVSHSLDTILKYSDCPGETADAFRQAICEYKDIVDKTANTDFLNRLRKKITSLFYEIYTCAFQMSLSDPKIPTVLKMFFLFGYVDEDLAGPEATAYLYETAETFCGDKQKGVYTFYEWLRAVYDGEKEPSRNEFDNDFTQYVHDLKVNNKIDAETEIKMLKDKDQRVMFELQNMFPVVNKITFGRVLTYCPVFSEHNLFKTAESSLVTPENIYKELRNIIDIDYSVFYRETIFTDPENGVPKESIKVEILPDIILMPNVGMRGVMWQEIEGKRRTTPSRMMIPILYQEDLSSLIIRLAGEFRWEMCKRVQGGRWNDVSDASLTSEYFDYIQFYRKNSELSPDVKEKIKITLQKTKGNYREAFVRDYISWVTLESKGSPVLNKLTRRILFTYCPFARDLRTTLRTNPLYKDYLDRYDIKNAQHLHHLDNVYLKISNAGKQVPRELEQHRKLMER